MCTGKPIGKPLEVHKGYVNGVAVGAIKGAVVMISGSVDGTVLFWDWHAAQSSPFLGIIMREPVCTIVMDDDAGVVVGFDRGIASLEILTMQRH
jgi:prepilin-type processing-associated H-X9-DG protein